MKISSMIIGIIFVGLFATAYGVLYWNIGLHYDKTYDNATLEIYTQQEELNTVITNLNETVRNPVDSSGGFNILGDYLSTGYNAIKATFLSFDVFTRLTFYSIAQFPGIGAYGQVIAIKIISIALIAFLFAVIAIFINREL